MPYDIRHVAVSTSDFAKTLTRLFPSLKEQYYLIRRRKKQPGRLDRLKKAAKYRLTEIGPSMLSQILSRHVLEKQLREAGFRDFTMNFFDHHLCHASAAAFCSGFGECAVLTLDGIGDGLSGSVGLFRDERLELIGKISGSDSLGIFFEHVTTLLNMRELEDEGKVSALATYAYPLKENPMNDFFRIEGITVHAKYNSLRMYRELRNILWKYPSEQFAYMAQRGLENMVTELAGNVMRISSMKKLAVAGGIFSNIKVNMRLREMPEVDDLFVFPHMGDGGLALGAALCLNRRQYSITSYDFEDICLGPAYDDAEVEKVLKQYNLNFRKPGDIAVEVAALIATGEIVFWFQGGMEYGPRALGHRSILARPDSAEIRDRLNMDLKMRVWYQPFCPSILEEDGADLLELHPGTPDRYMTSAYMVRPGQRDRLKGVMGKDGTCRPQIVNRMAGSYYELLCSVKKLTGTGAVLNTSFNLHGDPMVCSPEDAVKTFLKTNCRHMAINDYLVG